MDYLIKGNYGLNSFSYSIKLSENIVCEDRIHSNIFHLYAMEASNLDFDNGILQPNWGFL